MLRPVPILDHNGRAVPDGTPVEFQLSYQGESLVPIVQATTLGGSCPSVESGSIESRLVSVQARSDPARVSDILQLDVQEGQPAFVTVIAPSPVPTCDDRGNGDGDLDDANSGRGRDRSRG